MAKKAGKAKILSVQYQRNGISGIGFFAAIVENVFESEDTVGMKFLVTAEQSTFADEEVFDCTRTRVLLLDDVKSENLESASAWRGDNVSRDVLKQISMERGKKREPFDFDFPR